MQAYIFLLLFSLRVLALVFLLLLLIILPQVMPQQLLLPQLQVLLLLVLPQPFILQLELRHLLRLLMLKLLQRVTQYFHPRLEPPQPPLPNPVRQLQRLIAHLEFVPPNHQQAHHQINPVAIS